MTNDELAQAFEIVSDLGHHAYFCIDLDPQPRSRVEVPYNPHHSIGRPGSRKGIPNKRRAHRRTHPRPELGWLPLAVNA